MADRKYVVYYKLAGRGGGIRVVVDAPDSTAARNMVERAYGPVTHIVRDPSLEKQPAQDFSYEEDERGLIHGLGRQMAREHLGVIGESLPDSVIAALILLVLGSPVVGLWIGLPVYQAVILSPNVGVPPWTLGVGVGVAAFLVGWVVLYLCPSILLRIVGLFVYAGWFVYYVAGWQYKSDILQSVAKNIIMSNTDTTNLQKVGLLIAGIAGASVMSGLGKAVKGYKTSSQT